MAETGVLTGTAGRVDVTDVQTDEVRAYARAHRDVYLERKGARTYLVADDARVA